jgi:phosphonate transport system substrate-binding protein
MSLRKLGNAAIVLCVFAAISLSAQDKPIVFAIVGDGLTVAEREPLRTYLTKEMGREVKLVIPDSYNHTAAGLGDGSIDFALLGAVNYVRAHAKIGVVPLVQRPSDLNFHSVFITRSGSSIHSLKDLKGKSFAFNDPYSTSGHVIPYVELKKAGINQESDLKFRYSGGHPNTAKLVEGGIVDAGSMDELIYQSLIDNGKIDPTKVRVFYTSKPFVDWVIVGRKDLPDAERKRFSKSLEALKEGRDDRVLAILRAKQFIPASDDKYALVRQVVKELKLFD